MRSLCLVVALASLSACGSGVSISKACMDQATARCNKRMTCTGGASITKVYGDMTTCLTREALSCTQGLSAKNTGNSPSEVEQCVAALPSVACLDFLIGNLSAPCVATGPEANGTACAFAGQCSSTYCTNTKNANCGTCGTPPATGGDCTSTGCARGAACVTTALTATPTDVCVVEGAGGAMCNRDNPCQYGQSCVGSTRTAMGTCMASVTTAGATCDPTQVMGPGCERTNGLFCNTMTKLCTAVAYAADGAACGIGTDGNFTDCAAGECFGYTTGRTPMPGVCKADAKEGAACDTTNGPNCLPPARCVTAAGSTAGTCTVPDATKC
jgi:hypothetical protein